MNNEFRYILQKYTGQNSRYTCPACQKKSQFALYIDNETKQPLADHVGRCNREVNCGYHYTPKQYFEEQKFLQPDQKPVFKPQPKPPQTSFSSIPFALFSKTRKAYNQNNFAQYLFKKLGQEKAGHVLGLYHVGTSKHWHGANIFWQIDSFGKVRAGKVMLYDQETGHRIKEPYPHITWIHKLANLQGYQLNQCLFGEHLLKLYPDKSTAIVESEKTAILAAAYWPEFNWLAAGNLNNLSRERCLPLKGKTVLLLPDAGALHIWQQKAEALKDLASFTVSDLVERSATPEQRKAGFDIADYLEAEPEEVFTGRKEFEQTPDIKKTEEAEVLPEQIHTLKKASGLPDVYNPKESWPVEELESFFSSALIPEEVLLNKYATILNPKSYIKEHLATVKANNGKATFKPYLERLIQLKQILETT